MLVSSFSSSLILSHLLLVFKIGDLKDVNAFHGYNKTLKWKSMGHGQLLLGPRSLYIFSRYVLWPNRHIIQLTWYATLTKNYRRPRDQISLLTSHAHHDLAPALDLACRSAAAAWPWHLGRCHSADARARRDCRRRVCRRGRGGAQTEAWCDGTCKLPLLRNVFWPWLLSDMHLLNISLDFLALGFGVFFFGLCAEWVALICSDW